MNAPNAQPVSIVPKGALLHLKPEQIRPSPSNPRRLFDPGPLKALKDSIRTHGVLVPLTVYRLPGQERYAIVDGERRHRCCVELEKEGLEVTIPANVVESPDRMASLIYMFNIHSFREQWELMPTALSLQKVIEDLGGNPTNEELHELTGLSTPQIERCRTILRFPKRFQDMSLEEDPKKRIPSNFWIELYPVLNQCGDFAPDLAAQLGRDGITDRLIEKYRANKIKSVIHFRRIVEAFDIARETDRKEEVGDRFREYVLTTEFETRAAFDHFILNQRKVQRAVGACDRFIVDLQRSRVDLTIESDRAELVSKLTEVIAFAQELMEKLRSSDPPEELSEEESENIGY
ncbi:MAG: ParB/RepB/Spo0J family partition protein [Gemmatimonadetes bacterium]|nr:ParB/RepB/Spo0J family partition protein [Gemmatimonadota bacterium]